MILTLISSDCHNSPMPVLLPALFVATCVVLPIVLDFIEPKPVFFTPGNPSALQDQLYSYAVNPTTITWGSVCLIAVVIGHLISKGKLNSRDSQAANWYLVNAVFFNSAMDVFAGTLQLWPGMSHRYNDLDPRYPYCKGLIGGELSGCPDHRGLSVYLTSLQELLVQVPLGLLCYWAYRSKSRYRQPLEVAHCMWAIAGTYYFYVSEVVSGMQLVTADEAEWTPVQRVVNFYLGFIIFPLVWIIIPARLAMTAGRGMALGSQEKKSK